MKLRTIFQVLAASLLLTFALSAQDAAASRYDNQIQTEVAKKLDKKQFGNVKASVEDGIVTLTGTVDLYQTKLDAAKQARKVSNAAGVRNLLVVAGPNVPDAQLEEKLATKLAYVRSAYDNVFAFFDVNVKDGVVTVDGIDRTGLGRDEAMYDIATMPGVKDVVSNVSVAPASFYDDRIRMSALRAIYRDSSLSRYAMDPAKPIRIIVENGKVTLYGAVSSQMEKQIAGMRAGQVPGAFSVENRLDVIGKS